MYSILLFYINILTTLTSRGRNSRHEVGRAGFILVLLIDKVIQYFYNIL